jgi:hypothetical protein
MTEVVELLPKVSVVDATAVVDVLVVVLGFLIQVEASCRYSGKYSKTASKSSRASDTISQNSRQRAEATRGF